jgi:hypothetical protein
MTTPSTQPVAESRIEPELYLVVVVTLNGRWVVACRDVVAEHEQEPAARALAAQHTEHHHEAEAA